MILTGTMFIIDEPHLDVLKANLSRMPPPGIHGPQLAACTALCMDMDETDNMLEMWFPDHCQKATLLCPPPAAMYKEIDGDMEGFIKEYNEYLDYDSNVQEFIGSMLMYLHVGGNVMLYTPSHLEDDSLWTNTLILFFFTRYGITIGTSNTNPYAYDPRYDGVIADSLYGNGYIDIMEYLNLSDPNMQHSLEVYNRLKYDLTPMCPGEDPMKFYYTAKNLINTTGSPVFSPAIVFN